MHKSATIGALGALVLGGIVAASDAATAQSSYPTQPIRMIVPYAPGGASDFLARIVAPKMSELLGQQVVVDNRSGGAGNVGMDTAARSAPDGYTLFLGDIGAVELNPNIYSSLRVKPLKDFIPISVMTETPLLLVTHPSVPANTVQELIAHSKSSPKRLSFASPGSSTLDRMVMEKLSKLAGMQLNHVPYGGGAGPAAADVVGGHVQLMFGTISSTLPHVQSGRLKALAVSTPERAPALPNTPTVVELGFADAVGISWQGLLVPAGTPRPIVDKLHATVAKVMADPEVQSRLAERGGKAVASASPEEFRDFIVKDEQKWVALIKELNIKPD